MRAKQLVLREINPGNMSDKLITTMFCLKRKTMCSSKDEKHCSLINQTFNSIKLNYELEKLMHFNN